MSLYRRTPKPGQPQSLIWHYKFQIPGCKPERKSTNTTNENDAKKIERMAYSKALLTAKGVLTKADVEVPAVALSVLAERYLAWAPNDHPATADTDVCIVNRFVAIIGAAHPFVHTIDYSAIERWRDVRRTQKTRKGTLVTRSAVNRELNVVRAMFRQAVLWGYLKTTPLGTGKTAMKDYKLGKDKKPIRVLDAGELERAFNLPEPYNLFCKVTYHTLSRLAEVTSLRNEHVTVSFLPNGHQIGKLTKQVKGGNWKTVQIPLALAQRLRAQVTSDDQQFIFPDHQNIHTVSCDFTRLFRKAGLRCTHHVFRHTGITRMLEAGVNPRAIQEHAGWSSLKQLQNYGHVLDQEYMRAVTSTEDYLVQARAERAAQAKKGGAA
jgi:integrase